MTENTQNIDLKNHMSNFHFYVNSKIVILRMHLKENGICFLIEHAILQQKKEKNKRRRLIK